MPEPDPLASLSVKRADQDIMKGLSIDSGYAGMDKAVKGLGNLPGLTDTILPSIKALLMPGENNPYAKLIDASTQGNVAAAQTDAMRRGLTGSDIEAASMLGARQGGEMAKSNFFAQNAGQMADFVNQLVTGDISTQRENLIMMAQLMGQKITNDQDLAMFREMLQANKDQADKNRKASLWGAGISAVGSGAGAAITKFSDERLKVGVKRIGTAQGVGVYSFRWNNIAQAMLGAHDRVEVGVLAQEIRSKWPEASRVIQGWLAVDYARLPSSLVDEVFRLGAAYA